MTERKKCPKPTFSVSVYWVSKFILNLSALQKCLQPPLLPTILHSTVCFPDILVSPDEKPAKAGQGTD